MNGKGSRQRPKSVPPKTWKKNYERIFKKCPSCGGSRKTWSAICFNPFHLAPR